MVFPAAKNTASVERRDWRLCPKCMKLQSEDNSELCSSAEEPPLSGRLPS